MKEIPEIAGARGRVLVVFHRLGGTMCAWLASAMTCLEACLYNVTLSRCITDHPPASWNCCMASGCACKFLYETNFEAVP